MSQQFDENGNYIKTDWKAGDKITATKLNKIEDSLETINNNDISRHVEADARLDALESGSVSNKSELQANIDALEDTVVANKDELDLDIYRIDQHMTLLDKKIDDSVAEVNANVTSGDTILQNNIDTLQSNLEANDAALLNDINERLSLLGGTITGNVQLDITEAERSIDFVSNDQRLTFWYGVDNLEEASGPRVGWYDKVNERHIMYYDTANVTSGVPCPLYVNANLTPRTTHLVELGSDSNRWKNLYLSNHLYLSDGINNTTVTPNAIGCQTSALFLRGGTASRGVHIDGSIPSILPDTNNLWQLGGSSNRYTTAYLVSNPNVSSDRTMKENIEYIGKAKSGLTYADMYNFVKDDLGLATYNFIGDDTLRMNFIAQDLLVNEDGTDNKVGQMIVNPVAVPPEEEIAEGKPYPTLSYDTGMYVSVLAGALKEAINKIEELEARINELENK